MKCVVLSVAVLAVNGTNCVAVSSKKKIQRLRRNLGRNNCREYTIQSKEEKSMTEIRRVVAQGYSHNYIMNKLKLPPRTYVRYLSEAFDHDWQLLKQEDNDAAILALEISKLKETFREAQRMLWQIINTHKTPVRQRVAACDALCRTATADLQLTYQGPLIMNRAIKDIDLAWHFKGRFLQVK